MRGIGCGLPELAHLNVPRIHLPRIAVVVEVEVPRRSADEKERVLSLRILAALVVPVHDDDHRLVGVHTARPNPDAFAGLQRPRGLPELVELLDLQERQIHGARDDYLIPRVDLGEPGGANTHSGHTDGNHEAPERHHEKPESEREGDIPLHGTPHSWLSERPTSMFSYCSKYSTVIEISQVACFPLLK